MGNPMLPGFRVLSSRALGKLVWLAPMLCGAPLAARAQNWPVTGMLTATAPVRINATAVIPQTPNTPSQNGPQPGLLSTNSPESVAPSPTTPMELPLPDLPNGPNPSGASPTASGSALAGQGASPDAAKGTIDLGQQRKFQYHFELSIIGTYDDNIFLDAHNKRDDFFTIIQPRITLGFGDIESRAENFIRFDYLPSIFLFASFDDQDTVQHLMRLDAQYRFSKLTLSLNQEVQILDGADLTGLDSGGAQSTRPNIDVAGRTEVNIYSTNLTANYLLTEKSSLELGLLYSISDYDSLLDSTVLSSDFYYNYAYDPKLTVGLGLSGGYVFAQSPTPDQTFEQINFRLTYVATDKLSFIGTLGVEGRQSDGRSGVRVSPVFDMSALYLPFDGTTIGFTASRRILNSALLGGEDYISTGFSLSLRQRLFSRFFFSVSGGYENEDYVSERDGFSATREDNYFFVQTGLDVTVREWLTAGISYQHRENFSSGNSSFVSATSASSFDDNQVSFRVTFKF